MERRQSNNSRPYTTSRHPQQGRKSPVRLRSRNYSQLSFHSTLDWWPSPPSPHSTRLRLLKTSLAKTTKLVTVKYVERVLPKSYRPSVHFTPILSRFLTSEYHGHSQSTCSTSSSPAPHSHPSESWRFLLCKKALRGPCPVSRKSKLRQCLKSQFSPINPTLGMNRYVTRPLRLLSQRSCLIPRILSSSNRLHSRYPLSKSVSEIQPVMYGSPIPLLNLLHKHLQCIRRHSATHR